MGNANSNYHEQRDNHLQHTQQPVNLQPQKYVKEVLVSSIYGEYQVVDSRTVLKSYRLDGQEEHRFASLVNIYRNIEHNSLIPIIGFCH